MSLRRYYHHQLRYHRRFHVAVLLTIVAVSYVAVPAVLDLVESAASYNPVVYEPKDFDRAKQVERQPDGRARGIGWNNLLKITLFVLAALAWLAVGPPGNPARRPFRR